MKKNIALLFYLLAMAITPSACFSVNEEVWVGKIKVEWGKSPPIVSFLTVKPEITLLSSNKNNWYQLTCEAESEGYWGCYFPEIYKKIGSGNVVKFLLDKPNLRVIAIKDLGDLSHYDFLLKKYPTISEYVYIEKLEYLVSAEVNELTVRKMEKADH